MAAGLLLAGVVQEPLSDVLPDRATAIEANRICGLDLHDTPASAAGDTQNVALNLRELSLG
jgi:hypothetical protein